MHPRSCFGIVDRRSQLLQRRGGAFYPDPILNGSVITAAVIVAILVLPTNIFSPTSVMGFSETFSYPPTQRVHPTQGVQCQNKAPRYSFIDGGNYATRELTIIRDGLTTGRTALTLTSDLVTTDKGTRSTSVHESLFLFFPMYIKKSCGRHVA